MTAAPAALDKQSTTWFTAVCNGEKDLTKKVQSVPPAPDEQTTRKVFQDAYRALAASASGTRKKLGALPPPTIAGVNGASLKAHRLAQFAAVANGYHAGAVAIAASGVDTTAEFAQAINAVELNVQKAVAAAAEGTPALPGPYATLVAALPACRS